MLKILMPKDDKFFVLVERMAAKIQEGARAFQELTAKIEEREAFAKRIKDIEHACDTITHETMEDLNKSFVTPFDREDIHLLISRMDDVMDFIDASTQRINLYNVNHTTPEVREMAAVLVMQVDELAKAVGHLRDIKKGTKSILQICIEINRLENTGDDLLRSAVAGLFKTPGVDPLEVIKWKEVYEKLEVAIDRCEDVANVLEAIVLKNA
ncbi:MAG: DUF47 domain-containing protein [Deltaproteobacteria bacterium]|nr:DUF47 domain-containing protein [Deltaproteobacteria bacterium]